MCVLRAFGDHFDVDAFGKAFDRPYMGAASNSEYKPHAVGRVVGSRPTLRGALSDAAFVDAMPFIRRLAALLHPLATDREVAE